MTAAQSTGRFRSFKYRLFTNANQERELAIMLETHRRLYNVALDYRNLAYDCYGAKITSVDVGKWFTHQRLVNPYFARLNHTCATQTLRRLDRAFEAFLRRVKGGDAPGYPRFKGKQHFHSVSFTMPAKWTDGSALCGRSVAADDVA